MTKRYAPYHILIFHAAFFLLLISLIMGNGVFADRPEYQNADEKDPIVHPVPMSSLAQRLGGNATGIYYPMYNIEELPQVIAAKDNYSNIPFNVNINPADGPGTLPSKAWTDAIGRLRGAGAVVTGYVPTRYGAMPIATVESMISRYQQFYPQMLDGIMFDQVSSSNFTYYKEITDYARSLGFSYLRANPGGPLLQEDVPLFNQSAIYEGSDYPSKSVLESRTFYPQYSKDKVGFGATIHTTPRYDPSWLSMAAKYLKWVYITDQTEPNPYAKFPSYFDQYLVDLAYLQQPHHYITIDALDANGNKIKGIYVWLETTSGDVIKHSYTPCTFAVDTGTTYRIVMADYGNHTFNHWQDQPSNDDRHRVILIESDTTLNGVYSGQGDDKGASDLIILTMDKFGHPIDGMSTWLETPSGDVIQKSFTPTTFNVLPDEEYKIVLSDYRHDTFGYWQDQANNTDRHRIVSINNDTTLFGIYQVKN